MSETYKFIIPGRPFLLQTESLREEFRRIIGTPNESISVSRIFDFIHLTLSNAKLQMDLIKRGTFNRSAGNVFSNSGRVIDAIARDIAPDIPALGIYIPRSLTLTADYKGGIFSAVPNAGTRVLITFEKPPFPGAGQRFVFEKIEGSNETWTYYFHEDFAENRKVIIVIDMRLSPGGRVLREADPSSGRRLTFRREPSVDLEYSAFGMCSCECCEPFRPIGPNCPPIDKLLDLSLRVIVLLDTNENFQTFQAAVNRQIQAMTELYQQQRIRITIMGPTVVTDPARLIINPGDCFRGQPSADTVNLFNTYAGNIQANEIACFIVRQVVGLAGCAAHPDGRPGFVMDRTINDPRDSVMGHELGHVLSLNHVPDRQNLMWGADGNPIQDPPPDLYPDQISAIRCYPSPWLR